MFGLTTPQVNIWNLQKFYENTSIQNICGAVLYDELLDRKLLEQAINEEICLQSGLRLRFTEGSGIPAQYIEEYSFSEIEFVVFNSEADFYRYAKDFAAKPFPLIDSQMYRFVRFELNGNSGVLVCASHLISDAWAFSILARDIYNIYCKLAASEPIDFPERSYADSAKSEQDYLISARYGKDKVFWEQQYTNKLEPSPIKMQQIPVDTPSAKRFTKQLTATETSAIDSFCANSKVSQAVLFEAAIIAYLYRINQENKTITIGIPVLNRNNSAEKNTVGMFISTMPLTVDIIGEDTAALLCDKITDYHSRIFRHQKYPYSHILQNLREKSNLSGNPYDVMVSYQNAKTNINGRTWWFPNGYSETPFVMHIDNRDSTDCYTLTIDYQTELFRQDGEISLLTDRILLIVRQMISNNTVKIKDLAILPKSEYQHVIYDFNDTTIDYPKGKCVHELFSEQAVKTPDKIALVFEDKQFTYKQLDELSNSLAHYLRDKGVKPNDIVPIIAKRDWRVIVAMLGILKTGGAYMPVDQSYPVERIEYMLETAKSKIALTYGYPDKLSIETIDLTDFDFSVSATKIDNVNTSNDLCYIIFTSGSTGKPKGVMITHKNLVNFGNLNKYSENQQCYMLESCSSALSISALTFDISVYENIFTLINGLKLVFANDDEITSSEMLSKLITKHNVDIIHSTPTKLVTFLNSKAMQNALQNIKVFMIGAENFSVEMYKKIKLCSPQAAVFNGYGPSETTIGCTFCLIDDKCDITIGNPIANTQVYILDQNRKPLPIGVAGELCISGDGVGEGYLNRPELTAEKFTPNPFIEGKTMYRTGDLARWRADGELEYLGRIDTQVKIRGLRIELGEIESVLSTFMGIQLAAVTDKRDENGRQYLVGYYTAGVKIDEKALRQHLSAKLPKYMIPNYFMQLDEMPMTASGKTDRKNLPVPEFSTAQTEFVLLETQTEIRTARLWSELLKVDKIGRDDDFFDLGGDSLLAITLLARLETEFNADLSMKDIMEHSALKAMAAFLDSARKRSVTITAHHKDKYILLPQQKTIYAVCSKNPVTLTYNMPAFVSLPESVDREKIKACFKQLMNKHRMLKSRIKAENGDIYGIYDENAELEFEEYENYDYSAFVRPFDLSKAPLIRVAFTTAGMLVDMHHIISDGESLNIILRDLAALYKGETAAESEAEYSDYAEYYAGADFSAHKEYFKNILKCDFEPIPLPERRDKGSGGISAIYNISKNIFDSGRNFARMNGLTDTMLYLGAFGILLSKYSAKSDILSSIILTNRTHRETANIVGMFVNTLPIVLSARGTVREYFAAVKELVLNLYEYQELPFFEIAQAVKMNDINAVNTSFVYQADGEKLLTVGGASLAPQFIDTHTAKFDLTFELTPNENGCVLRIEYNSGKYDNKLIDRLFASYVRIIEQLSEENIANINVLSEEEYQKVIYDFNDTAVEYAKDRCVHELFTEQAVKTPDKVALVFENEHFTYKLLDEMSNSLAHFLREKGIKPNDVVPIIAKRDWRIIVAMLGILKAGGAYMPVDPSYPAERIEYMLETANSRIALSYGYFNKLNVETIDLSDFDFSANTQNIENVNSPSDLCYIIFTSGSTGKPKGVALRHSNVANYCDNNNNNVCCKIIKSGYESIVSVTNIVFDIFVTESLLPLVNGLTIYFANDEQVFSQQKLSELFSNSKIEVMQTTPTKMRSYIFDKKNVTYLSQLKAIVLGGEAFPADLYEELKKYTSAEIFNIYGPAETTVWSTNKLVESTDITIGKPIANTQVYILDQNRKPLPIGVAGELCISGDGVGAGYLNRPELTAEKFISNPFVEGKTMYCTGDLARWRDDGEIEYLGRIDTQVKIRGLRIELGEIESIMSTFAGIQLAAVTDKRDENGRQYLVGYYTADSEIDERGIRAHLSAKLPKYMIPNYFMRLDEMPMTASGKTDRKNLPAPQMTALADERVAPQNELESALNRIAAEILETDQIGVTDDFFDFGGDSLRAIEYVAKAHNEGIEFTLQSVFDYPTVRELCGFIENGEERKAVYSAKDFEKFSEILSRNVIDENFVPVRKTLGNVLLTGATGFLGAHVLDSLMKNENGKIYCLVRSQKQDDRRGRLCEILNYYFGNTYNNEIGKRIIPIIGNVEQIGLSDNIPYDVQTVIHTAATVKHYGSYEYFRNVNVQGTENVINYAKKCGARLIHISTISVSGNSFADEFEAYRSAKEKNFDETSLYIGQPLENVYIHSKFEAEIVVLNAVLEGLDAKIVRVGNLTNRQSDFKFQPNYRENAFLTRVKAMLDLGLFPDYLLPLYSEFSPIDATADGVVKIAQYADKQNVFHLNSNKPIYFDKLLDVLHELNIRMKTVSSKEFNDTLQQLAKASKTEYIYEAFQNDMDENGQLVYDSNIRIINEFTVWFMKKVGFEWKQTDFDYIKGYIDYFRDIGYLEV